jgi:hypothetical protein
LGDGAPVFALEHDLSAADLALMESTVRAAVAQGFGLKHRRVVAAVRRLRRRVQVIR